MDGADLFRRLPLTRPTGVAGTDGGDMTAPAALSHASSSSPIPMRASWRDELPPGQLGGPIWGNPFAGTPDPVGGSVGWRKPPTTFGRGDGIQSIAGGGHLSDQLSPAANYRVDNSSQHQLHSLGRFAPQPLPPGRAGPHTFAFPTDRSPSGTGRSARSVRFGPTTAIEARDYDDSPEAERGGRNERRAGRSTIGGYGWGFGHQPEQLVDGYDEVDRIERVNNTPLARGGNGGYERGILNRRGRSVGNEGESSNGHREMEEETPTRLSSAALAAGGILWSATRRLGQTLKDAVTTSSPIWAASGTGASSVRASSAPPSRREEATSHNAQLSLGTQSGDTPRDGMKSWQGRATRGERRTSANGFHSPEPEMGSHVDDSAASVDGEGEFRVPAADLEQRDEGDSSVRSLPRPPPAEFQQKDIRTWGPSGGVVAPEGGRENGLDEDAAWKVRQLEERLRRANQLAALRKMVMTRRAEEVANLQLRLRGRRPLMSPAWTQTSPKALKRSSDHELSPRLSTASWASLPQRQPVQDACVETSPSSTETEERESRKASIHQGTSPIRFRHERDDGGTEFTDSLEGFGGSSPRKLLRRMNAMTDVGALIEEIREEQVEVHGGEERSALLEEEILTLRKERDELAEAFNEAEQKLKTEEATRQNVAELESALRAAQLEAEKARKEKEDIKKSQSAAAERKAFEEEKRSKVALASAEREQENLRKALGDREEAVARLEQMVSELRQGSLAATAPKTTKRAAVDDPESQQQQQSSAYFDDGPQAAPRARAASSDGGRKRRPDSGSRGRGSSRNLKNAGISSGMVDGTGEHVGESQNVEVLVLEGTAIGEDSGRPASRPRGVIVEGAASAGEGGAGTPARPKARGSSRRKAAVAATESESAVSEGSQERQETDAAGREIGGGARPPKRPGSRSKKATVTAAASASSTTGEQKLDEAAAPETPTVEDQIADGARPRSAAGGSGAKRARSRGTTKVPTAESAGTPPKKGRAALRSAGSAGGSGVRTRLRSAGASSEGV